jgi:hypothetical protein
LEEHITGTNLDKSVKRDLGTLNEDNSLIVARHLEAAAFYLDEDPERALQHALAAKRRASRLAVVRETVGLLAYVTEDFATALSELRAFQRISGSEAQVAIIIDCLRALDRSEDALKIARALDRSSLPGEAQIDLAIVLSGIRLDRGEADRALAELQIPQLDPTKATVECVALFDANAEVLEELGRVDEAAQWRRYARLTEAAYAPEETLAVETERLFTEEELEGDGVNLDTIDSGYEPPASDDDELDELLSDEDEEDDEDELEGDDSADADADADAAAPVESEDK